MKKIILMALAIVSVITFDSCKSQQTLSEATTVAETEEEITEVQPIQYTKPTTATTAAPVVESTPKVAVKPATPDRTEKVTVVETGDSGKLKSYNVIVGSFGSKTNAENQKNKMISRGHRSAFLVQNASGMYRVVAASFDTREAATVIRDQIRTTYPTESGTCAEAWLLIPQR